MYYIITINDIKNSDNEKEYWGFASYDIDQDEDDDATIIYTRHEKSGRVNQYVDNQDGGHGHFSWPTERDYEDDDDDHNTTDYSREESNDRENPSQAEVEKRSGCYLTSACISHYKEHFDDNCFELNVLRKFRDIYVPQEEIQHYYNVAPHIVSEIEKEKNAEIIFNKIYTGIVCPCVQDIIYGNYKQAYTRYKRTILAFENKYKNKKSITQNIDDLEYNEQ